MEVLLINLSLNRFFIKLESSQPQARKTGPPAGTLPPLAVYPPHLLDGSSVVFDFSYVYVLAGFTVNECRLQTASVTPWTQSDYRYHSLDTQVKLKVGVALRRAPRFAGENWLYSITAKRVSSSENRERRYRRR